MTQPEREMFRQLSIELHKTATDLIPLWFERVITQRLNGPATDEQKARISEIAAQCKQEISHQLESLLALEPEEQWTNPLSILRKCEPYATELLKSFGVEPVKRDKRAEEIHPLDVFDVIPGAFADFGLELHELGISWGAAKTYLHLQNQAEASKP